MSKEILIWNNDEKMNVLYYHTCAPLPICRSDLRCVLDLVIFCWSLELVEHGLEGHRTKQSIAVSDYGIVDVHFSFLFYLPQILENRSKHFLLLFSFQS